MLSTAGWWGRGRKLSHPRALSTLKGRDRKGARGGESREEAMEHMGIAHNEL